MHCSKSEDNIEEICKMSQKNRLIDLLSGIPRGYYFFGIFCVLFVGLFVAVEMNNGKFWTNDFVVYYEATKDYFSGNNPYGVNYGLDTGFFKYAPTTLYFFSPTILVGFFTAQIMHTLLLMLALITSMWILHRMFIIDEIGKRRMGLLYVGFALIAPHIVREFHMGNVNLLLLFFFCSGLFALQKKKDLQVALLWSIMIVLKPIVILAFIPLLFYKKWKIIFTMGGIGLLFLLLPMLFSGYSGTIELWTNWLKAISDHGNYIVSENSLTYLLEWFTGIQSTWGASLVILVLFIGFLLWNKLKMNAISLIEWIVVFFAFCPNFFVTDTEHFLLSLPLIMMLIKHLIEVNKLGHWIAFGCFVFFFSLNINDLLGHGISNVLDENGVLGISNLCFILLFFIVRVQLNKKNFQAQLD
jgi:hypothetical protein